MLSTEAEVPVRIESVHAGCATSPADLAWLEDLVGEHAPWAEVKKLERGQLKLDVPDLEAADLRYMEEVPE